MLLCNMSMVAQGWEIVFWKKGGIDVTHLCFFAGFLFFIEGPKADSHMYSITGISAARPDTWTAPHE